MPVHASYQSAGTGDRMPFLVVVKRSEPALFDYLKAHFQEPEVTVLLDRREGERRRRDNGVVHERRQRQRRAPPEEADALWSYGFKVAVARED